MLCIILNKWAPNFLSNPPRNHLHDNRRANAASFAQASSAPRTTIHYSVPLSGMMISCSLSAYYRLEMKFSSYSPDQSELQSVPDDLLSRHLQTQAMKLSFLAWPQLASPCMLAEIHLCKPFLRLLLAFLSSFSADSCHSCSASTTRLHHYRLYVTQMSMHSTTAFSDKHQIF